MLISHDTLFFWTLLLALLRHGGFIGSEISSDYELANSIWDFLLQTILRISHPSTEVGHTHTELRRWRNNSGHVKTTDEADTRDLDGKRIYNGLDTIEGEYPYVVALLMIRRVRNMHNCAGAIVASDWILTAAHCVFSNWMSDRRFKRELRIVAGKINFLPYGKSGQTGRAARIIVHADFDNPKGENDIAVVKLRKPFEFNQFVQAIPLIEKAPTAETWCYVAGWGYVGYRGGVFVKPGQLKSAHVPISTDYVCARNFKNHTDHRLCTGYLEGPLQFYRTPCRADSGDPLVCEGHVAGIAIQVTGAFICGVSRLPTAYTNVAYFRKWIERRIGIH